MCQFEDLLDALIKLQHNNYETNSYINYRSYDAVPIQLPEG